MMERRAVRTLGKLLNWIMVLSEKKHFFFHRRTGETLGVISTRQHSTPAFWSLDPASPLPATELDTWFPSAHCTILVPTQPLLPPKQSNFRPTGKCGGPRLRKSILLGTSREGFGLDPWLTSLLSWPEQTCPGTRGQPDSHFLWSLISSYISWRWWQLGRWRWWRWRSMGGCIYLTG